MNQRIRLMSMISEAFDESRVTEKEARKFLELIINECVEQGRIVQSQRIYYASDDYLAGRELGIEVCLVEIERHFGVRND
jgi:hypothetical protein